MNRELHVFRKYVQENGYRIYTIPSGQNHYKIVIAKATKYSWSDIERTKRDQYEEVDRVIYSLKVGETEYKRKPTSNDEKYWFKIEELYLVIFERITKIKIDYNNLFKSIVITMKTDELKNKYDSICYEFIERFCTKHNLVFESWVNDEPGTVANISGDHYEFTDIVIEMTKFIKAKPINKAV